MLAARKLDNDLYAPIPLSEEPPATAVQPMASPKVKPRYLKALTVGLIGSVFACGLLFSSMAAGVTAKGYAINQLKNEIKALEVSNQRLRLEAAQMASLERVEAVAITELGMKMPEPSDYILLPGNERWMAVEAEEGPLPETAVPKEVHDGEAKPLFTQKAASLLSMLGRKNAMD